MSDEELQIGITYHDFQLILEALRDRSENQTLTVGELEHIHSLSEKIRVLTEGDDLGFLDRIAEDFDA